MPEVTISLHLAQLARRFEIDLTELVDEALLERILREPLTALTPRMREILLSAHQEARRRGHRHIGTEHVFLATLLDRESVPAQLMRQLGTRDSAIEQLQNLLVSDEYNKA